MEKNFISKIKKEIETDKRTYLENCKKYRGEYIEAAIILFPEYYNNFNDDYNLYIKKAIELKENKQYQDERKLLEKAISNKTSIPYAYKRLARILIKDAEPVKALDICNKWFNSIFWKIPNMATTSLNILDLKEKLESKL